MAKSLAAEDALGCEQGCRRLERHCPKPARPRVAPLAGPVGRCSRSPACECGRPTCGQFWTPPLSWPQQPAAMCPAPAVQAAERNKRWGLRWRCQGRPSCFPRLKENPAIAVLEAAAMIDEAL